MDGVLTDLTPPYRCRPRRLSAFLVAALIVSWSAPTQGQTPLHLERASQPIPLNAAPWRPSVQSPKLLRPRAMVIDAKRSPAVAMLSANESQTPSPLPAPTPPQASQPQGSLSQASPTRPLTIEEALARKGTVTFRKTPLSEVVFLLSELWQINIVAGENVSGEVSGAFHDAPLREVLSAALTATGYSYRQTGNSLIVLSIDEVGADDPNFVSEMIPLPTNLSDSDTTLEAAQLLLGERGQLKRVGNGAVLVVDTPDRVARVRQMFTNLSPPQAAATTNAMNAMNLAAQADNTQSAGQNGIAYFTPQFTEADEMAEPLREALGENVIVAVYPEENRLMIKGDREQLQLAQEAIEQLDVPRQQVRITAMIYDVGLSELEELGINISRDLRAVANARNEVLEGVSNSVNGFYAISSDLASGGATAIGLRTISDTLEASAFLQLLDSTSEAKLLADPSITVGDRREASIRIVRKIPIVGANPVQNSNAVFTQTEFEEAGVILNVMPRISRDGTIELKVSPEYSVVAEVTDTGPVIDSRTADTTVRVGNGQMFVLGGLRQKSIVESVRGIPYLMNLKYVGKLFRSHNSDVRESELIVFIKTELVSPYWTGTPREQTAACVASRALDRIPYATAQPQSRDCQDKNCPNHYPRCRVNGGSPDLDMLGGFGMSGVIGPQFVGQQAAGAQDIGPQDIGPEPIGQPPVLFPTAAGGQPVQSIGRPNDIIPPGTIGTGAPQAVRTDSRRQESRPLETRPPAPPLNRPSLEPQYEISVDVSGDNFPPVHVDTAFDGRNNPS